MGRRFGSKLGFTLLEVISDGVDIVQIANRRSGLLLRYDLQDLRTIEAERARRRVGASLLRMERRGLIKKKDDIRKSGYSLTRVGREILMNRSVRPVQMPPGWFTLVSFDIPESQKMARQAFRDYLRSLGFRIKHRSVWISDHDWVSNILQKKNGLRNPEWIVVYKAQEQ